MLTAISIFMQLVALFCTAIAGYGVSDSSDPPSQKEAMAVAIYAGTALVMWVIAVIL